MEKLSRFLEFSSIDSKLYWRIPSTQGKDIFEVQWRKGHPNPWKFRKTDEIFWKICPTEEVMPTLKSHGVDILTLETKVKYSTLQQVAFANKIVDDAKDLFGRDLVEQAIAENKAFMNQLDDAIKRLVIQRKPNPKKPVKLQLLKN